MDDAPVAMRRPRRSVGAPAAAPKTPRRQRKALRFSDPGPASSTGLTPSIRRTRIDTPRSRRASTPSRARCRPEPRPAATALSQAPAAAAPPCLRQTADARVERRTRRSNMRDLLNRLEQQKKRSASLARAEIGALQADIRVKDREIYEMQNATVVIDAERIWELEQQVERLREELQRRSDAPATPRSDNQACYDWALAGRHSDDAATDVAPDEDYFGESTMAQLAASTPSRARSSFPTPPATSPVVPPTPSWRALPPVRRPGPADAAVQACLPDPARDQLEEEMASLRLEVQKLTTTLESYQSLGRRIADSLPSEAPAVAGVQGLEAQIKGLLQAMSDRTAALAHLTTSVATLGFPGRDASDMLASLAAGFRSARLELEYLTPGEVVLPLSSHGAEVLELLLCRLRVLANKVQEDTDTIDEYHEIEQSLRKQLDARVTVIQALKADMSAAEARLAQREAEAEQLQVGNQRLNGAVASYVREVAELEKLVERMEQEAHEAKDTHQARQRSDRETLAAKEASIAELEDKLASAMRRTTSLQLEMGNVQDSSTRHVVALNKQHGAALALRDARVLELRGEVDRLNESLRAAHDTIRELRVDRDAVETRVRDDGRAAIKAVRDELLRVLQTSHFLDDAADEEDEGAAEDGIARTLGRGQRPTVPTGGFFAAAPARRGSRRQSGEAD